MKNSFFFTIAVFLLVLISDVRADELAPAPSEITYFNEIATQYNKELPALWNNLSSAERVFAYYMVRASMPGNRIMADQTHRAANALIDIFTYVMEHQNEITVACRHAFDVEKFLHQAELFYVYVSAHHGHYLLREFENHKRTPHNLELNLLTPENIELALQASGKEDACPLVVTFMQELFDEAFEPTLSVEGNIEKSAVNMYSRDFKQSDFDALPADIKTSLNTYCYVKEIDGQRVPQAERYKIDGRYSLELEVAHYWLTKAYQHALGYPEFFDAHIPASLAHLLTYLETGDEYYFKQFSIEWLKTKSRIDFNFGFVETYRDPMQCRGSFEADVTIKAIDMEKLNALLPSLEEQLPFPVEFKRTNLNDLSAIPNASVNAKIFASGDAGPVKITAAYCLPNYHEIREQYGSKQIIYQSGASLAEHMNAELARCLFFTEEQVVWLNANDPEKKLNADIWNVHVILHETLGHGSGRGATHLFVEGDPLNISGITYALGDIIPVTSQNSKEFIGGYAGALEELRAEILALYTSIYNFDELAASGLYKEWPQKIGKEKLIEWFILSMARSGLNRLLVQSDDAMEIVQAHARADNAILNYLLDHGSMSLVEEAYEVNGVSHTVLGLRINNLQQAMHAVKELACEVQRCTSTADGLATERLMKTYGTCVRHPEYIKILKANRAAIQGKVCEVAEIYPRLIPVYDEQENIIEVAAEWPHSFVEQQLELTHLALLKI